MEIQNAGKFYTKLEEKRAVCEYYYEDLSTLVLYHTFVPSEYRGQGIASKLIKEALDYAQRNQLKVIPRCSAVSIYIRRHPAYQDLLKKE